ncbi:copper transport protein [Streptomyces zagrosensis]|uniref:Protein YobA n=1 Tax=Streptomyces zagrosensis TaxID=1042984 RepID=A0A7W9Q7P0_9ACTN|nr:copper resistance protein CopC [Streptomyces zagrosensis]MBB5934242.1 copper transport protein [Streptomyces zagrosensis]
MACRRARAVRRPLVGRHRRPLTVLGTLLAALLCALGVGATPAAAHAALTGTDPAKGAVLREAPERVSLTFSEGVLLSDDSVRVLDPRGERVDDGKPAHVGGKSSTAAVRLRSGLPTGTFTVAWQAVSEDSHPVGGAYTFSIGAPSKTSVTVPSAEPDDTVSALYDIVRYAAYGGFVLLVGACVFAGRCHTTRGVQRVAATGWVALFAATVALLMLRGPYTSNGKGLGAAFDLGLLRDVLDTKPGTAMLSRLLLLAAAAVFLAVLFDSYAPSGQSRASASGTSHGTSRSAAGRGAGQSRGMGQGRGAGLGRGASHGRGEGHGGAEGPALGAGRPDLAWGLGIVGTLVAVGLAATWAMAEHASVGLQRSLAMPVDVLHLLAVAVWLGGLIALLVSLRSEVALPRLAVRRFSQLALASVGTLAATGLYQSWRQVGSWAALTDTEYGRWLLVKVGLVALLVGAAGFSRRWTSQLDAAPAIRTTKGTTKGPTNAKAERASSTKADTEPDAQTTAPSNAPATPHTIPPAVPPANAHPTARPRATSAAETKAGNRRAGKGAPSDSARAAQLARQRAAVSVTRTRRERDADPVRTGLRRSVAVETGIAVVLLAVTTVLTGTQPGRAETEQAAAQQGATADAATVRIAYDTGGPNGRGTAQVTLDPARSGDNQFHAYLTGPGGRPVDPPELKASLTLREKGVGPLSVALNRVSAGHWSAAGVQLPMPGDWQLSLTVRTSDIDQVTEIDTVKVGP